MRGGRRAGVVALLWACLIGVGLCPTDADAFNQMVDSRTSGGVSAEISASTNLSASDSTLGGPTGWDLTVTSNLALESPGTAHGTGFADFGVLKTSLNLSGPGAKFGGAGSAFHDVFTVATPPGVAPGSPGDMTLVYLIDGNASVTSTPGASPISTFTSDVASISMSVARYSSDGSGGVIFDGTDTRYMKLIGPESLDGTAVVFVPHPPDLLTFTVPFNYGEPIGLTTNLVARAFADNRFLGQQSNPFFLNYGGGVIQNVFIDYFNTAELVAIVNEDHPDVTITGVSSTDYSSLVTDTIPAIVPVPSAVLLFGSAIVGLTGFRRNGNRYGRG
ncbi:MAG: hypothetical protein CMJ49_06295 [Planctomycetaceae bacterium]|nr:hypothetical protein [Planctomycetaceae bacterium]